MAAPGSSKEEILRELESVLAAREFSGAGRLSAFLRYVVERSLEGDLDSLKESIIGTEVFGRPVGYDPKTEPIVRVEARRLRARLDEYYSKEDRWYRVRISVPKGGYAAVFDEGNRPREGTETTAVAEPPPAPEPPSPPARTKLGWLLGFALLGAAAIAVWLFRPEPQVEPVPVTLTSYPGTQSNPALSPDGTEVAFSWTNDQRPVSHIYVAPVRGGDPRPITSGPTADTFPEWSPDGSQIAFVRENRSLMVASRQGGNERRVGNAFGNALSWSPDGRWIAHVEWLPDGNHLAVFQTDPVSGETRQLTTPGKNTAADVLPAFSPDGKQLAFVGCGSGSSTCGAYIMPAAGGEMRLATDDRDNVSGLTWTSDGRGLIISARRSGRSQLWRVDASGSGRHELIASAGEDVLAPRSGRGTGGKVVYEQRVRDTNIWYLGADKGGKFGTPQRIIASTRLDSSPQFSPDGKSLVFVSDRSAYDELWRATADGRNETALTNMRERSLGSPRWSPDGSRIAFDVTSKGGRAIFVIGASGGAARQWTPWGSGGRPSWSRDGRWIYYMDADAAGVTQLWRISAEGGGSGQQLTTDGGMDPFESMDGKWLYYIGSHDLHRMPAAGGQWTRVIADRISAGWWTVTAAGIFYADIEVPGLPGRVTNKGPKPVYRWDPESGRTEEVARIDGQIIAPTPDFCVSPDGLAMVYSRLEISISQIRMIDGM
jgi:Tol biopolymer transport system component